LSRASDNAVRAHILNRIDPASPPRCGSSKPGIGALFFAGSRGMLDPTISPPAATNALATIRGRGNLPGRIIPHLFEDLLRVLDASHSAVPMPESAKKISCHFCFLLVCLMPTDS
jgi:hypothetical protein